MENPSVLKALADSPIDREATTSSKVLPTESFRRFFIEKGGA
tara:strand:+ start:21 stop:146 length:126 start_codon:yes stop_codon:yes gene_type:complete